MGVAVKPGNFWFFRPVVYDQGISGCCDKCCGSFKIYRSVVYHRCGIFLAWGSVFLREFIRDFFNCSRNYRKHYLQIHAKEIVTCKSASMVYTNITATREASLKLTSPKNQFLHKILSLQNELCSE